MGVTYQYNGKLKPVARSLRKSRNLAEVILWRELKNRQLDGLDFTRQTVIANFIGSLIFFNVDRIIFRSTSKVPLWEIVDDKECYECGTFGTCFRIVEWRGYNRRVVDKPQFRCEKCRNHKMKEIEVNLK